MLSWLLNLFRAQPVKAQAIKSSPSPAEKLSPDIVSSVATTEPLTVAVMSDGVSEPLVSENSSDGDTGDSMTDFGSEHWTDEIDWTPEADDDYEVDWQ